MIRSPRTNGFVERMNRTLLDECFRVAGRTTWYLEPEGIQRDLDRFLDYYNLERSHQGYRLKGRTPAQALREAAGDLGTANCRSRPSRGGGYDASRVVLGGGLVIGAGGLVIGAMV